MKSKDRLKLFVFSAIVNLILYVIFGGSIALFFAGVFVGASISEILFSDVWS